MVESKGIGKPDFVKTTTPSRTEVESTSQTAWKVTIYNLILPPDSTISFNVVTIPAKQKLILGYIKATTNIDCIFKSILTRNGSIYCPVFHPQHLVICLTDIAGLVFDAGDVLGVIITNPLDVALTLWGEVSGFLYEV